jgi:MFS family permease
MITESVDDIVHSSTAPRRGDARALRAWLAAGAVYLTGVFHRTSLGVAGLIAVHRFGISPGQLSVFVMVQLGVYAAMQVPTGVLVDRFGPRRLLLAAAGIMTVAQLGFALAPNYPMALLARALLGCGDALSFISVLRLVANNFSPRRYPLMVALSSLFGYAGNVLATVPLSILLHDLGWRPTFAGAALVSLLAGVAVFTLVPRTSPAKRSGTESGRSLERIRTAWLAPGTRLGFWLHFSCMSTATIFGTLWGLPFLVASGFSEAAAGGVLLTCVLVAIAASLMVGSLTAARPAWRVPVGLAICGGTVLGWSALLLLGGDHPAKALVVLLVAATASGGPASSIGFALARDYNRSAVVGTATGLVNVGGFIATIIGTAAVGLILELLGSDGPAAFRLAFAAAIAIQLYGTMQIVRCWRRLRADVLGRQDDGIAVPVPVHRHAWDLAVRS